MFVVLEQATVLVLLVAFRLITLLLMGMTLPYLVTRSPAEGSNAIIAHRNPDTPLHDLHSALDFMKRWNHRDLSIITVSAT